MWKKIAPIFMLVTGFFSSDLAHSDESVQLMEESMQGAAKASVRGKEIYMNHIKSDVMEEAMHRAAPRSQERCRVGERRRRESNLYVT